MGVIRNVILCLSLACFLFSIIYIEKRKLTQTTFHSIAITKEHFSLPMSANKANLIPSAPPDSDIKLKAFFLTTIKLVLYSSWWNAAWIVSAIVLFFLYLLYVLYKVRTRFFKNQKKKLEELVALRTGELEKSNEELRTRNYEIHARNEEIQTLLEEVAGQKSNIESKNEELHKINDELQVQRDAFELKSNELERVQTKLREINANLEVLVNKRTQKLNDALRELETFLYHASHDLRGPISSMLGLMQLSELEKNRNQFDSTYTAFLQSTILKLERTLQKLMQRHLIQRSKLSEEKITKASFIDLLENNLKEIPSFRAQDFELRIDSGLAFTADKMMLSIMLTNLLENAFFFSERAENKKVTMNIISSEKNTVITVEDRGAGIKDEMRSKIFTMFYRGNELSTGNGLGLYLIICVLNKIQGKIELETEEGSYAKFIITF